MPATIASNVFNHTCPNGLRARVREDLVCLSCVRVFRHVRHHSLMNPRERDASPCFEVVEPGHPECDAHRALRRAVPAGTIQTDA
jgi:hypothetical protein